MLSRWHFDTKLTYRFREGMRCNQPGHQSLECFRVEIFDPVVEHGPQCGHPGPPTLRKDLEAIPNRRVGRQAFPHRSIELQHQSAERNHRSHVDKCPLHRCHTERAQLADVSRLEPPRPMDSRPSYGGPVVPRNTQVDD